MEQVARSFNAEWCGGWGALAKVVVSFGITVPLTVVLILGPSLRIAGAGPLEPAPDQPMG